MLSNYMGNRDAKSETQVIIISTKQVTILGSIIQERT